jgi:hypothetical protein
LGRRRAVLIARHARRLLSDPLSRRIFQERERELARRGLAGAEPQEAESRLERGYRALYLADLLSLIACDGWTGPRPARLSDARGGEIELTAWREGDWTVRVRPWPFEPPRIEDAGVEAIPIFAGEEPQIAGRLRENLPRARAPRHISACGFARLVRRREPRFSNLYGKFRRRDFPLPRRRAPERPPRFALMRARWRCFWRRPTALARTAVARRDFVVDFTDGAFSGSSPACARRSAPLIIFLVANLICGVSMGRAAARRLRRRPVPPRALLAGGWPERARARRARASRTCLCFSNSLRGHPYSLALSFGSFVVALLELCAGPPAVSPRSTRLRGRTDPDVLLGAFSWRRSLCFRSGALAAQAARLCGWAVWGVWALDSAYAQLTQSDLRGHTY